MKDMKLTAAEKKESMPQAAKMDAPQYPYGLRIELDKDTIKKLGIDLPAIGEELEVRAIAKVISCHASQSAEGSDYASCSLQIISMEIKGESDVASIAGRLYKKEA